MSDRDLSCRTKTPNAEHDIPRLSTFSYSGQPPSTMPPPIPPPGLYDAPGLDQQAQEHTVEGQSGKYRGPSRTASSRRLRRSPFVVDLRGSVASQNISDWLTYTSSSVASASNAADEPKLPADRSEESKEYVDFVLYPEQPQASSSTRPASLVGPFTVDEERIMSWRKAATVLTRENIPSPISPRRFNEEELAMMRGETGRSESDNSEVPGYEPGMSTELLGEDAGEVIASLEQMRAVQERVQAFKLSMSREGQDQAEASNNTGEGRWEFDIAPPVTDKGKGKARADPVKVSPSASLVVNPSFSPEKLLQKPAPVFIPPRNPTLDYGRPKMQQGPSSDPQTYTTEGLVRALQVIYSPVGIPSPVLVALPKSHFLDTLSNPATPSGIIALRRAEYSPNSTFLTSKDRNYVSFYIDTLLSTVKELEAGIRNLEEECEDKEVDKANMQGDINFYFFEYRKTLTLVQRLERFNIWLASGVSDQHWKNMDTVAEEFGVDLDGIRGRLGRNVEAKYPSAAGHKHEQEEEDVGKGNEVVQEGGGSVDEDQESGPSGSKESSMVEQKNVVVEEDKANGSMKDSLPEKEKDGLSEKETDNEVLKENTGTADKKNPPATKQQGSDGTIEQLKKALKKSEKDRKYWKARAEVAEKYLAELQRDDSD